MRPPFCSTRTRSARGRFVEVTQRAHRGDARAADKMEELELGTNISS
ncbi:hypothetical protein AB0L64_06115 [Kribbella sp. NPDC051936]